MASALLRRLREAHPTSRITWVTGDTAAPLVSSLEGVDEVIGVDERKLLRGSAIARLGVLLPLWAKLLRVRPTHVLLAHVDWRYSIVTLPLVGAKLIQQQRVDPNAGRYMGDEFARLADEIVSDRSETYPLGEMRGRVNRAKHERPRVALVPGGAKNVLRESGLKRWPAESYAALARELIASGYEVVLAGDKSDDWVRPHFAGIDVTDRIGALSLTDTARLLGDCDLVVSHDTGPMHLARLGRTPVIALFGPTQPAQFAGRESTTTVLWGGEHLACRPCYDGREFAVCSDNQCMKSITVETVLTTARRILGASSTPLPRNRQTPVETPRR